MMSPTEKALSDSVEFFSQEFEMIGSLVELTPEEIASEWDVPLNVAKAMKSEAVEIHRGFASAVELTQRELSKVIEVNQKYWV